MPPLINYQTTYNNNSTSVSTGDSQQICLKHPLLPLPDAFVQPSKKRRINYFLRFPSTETKKSVKFAISSIAYRSNRTQEDISSSWYSREEMVTFRIERSEFIRDLSRVQWNLDRVDENKHCKRGFEAFFSKKINMNVQARRALSVKNVLNEQHRQKLLLHTHNDVESIRAVSLQVSLLAQDQAFERGVQDSDETLMDTLLELPFASFGNKNDNELDLHLAIQADGFFPLYSASSQPLSCHS